MRRVIIAAMASLIAFAAFGTSSDETARGGGTPFSVSVDCDTANSGVQNNCNFPIFTTQTVDIILSNDSGASSPIGGVTFRLNNSDITVLSPPQVNDPDPSLNSNPDFNQTAMTGTWDCNVTLAPDNDTGLVPGGTQSFINCISPLLNGPTLANGASIAIARVTYDVVGSGVSALSLANVRIQDNANEIHSCNPIVTTAGDCFGATVTVIALANEITVYHNNEAGTCTPGAVPTCTVLDPGPGGAGTTLVRHLGETFDAILAVTAQPSLAQSYQWRLRWTNSILDVAGGRTALDTSTSSCSTGPTSGRREGVRGLRV